MHSITQEPLRQSLRFFYRALEIDPSFARAYIGIAQGYLALGLWNFITWEESIGSARGAVRNALAIDNALPEAHEVLAGLAYMSDDIDGSATEAKIAIELNPNLADAYVRLGEYSALKGSADDWVKMLETAYQLDPLSPVVIRRLGYALFYSGKIEAAIEHWKRTLHLDPYNTYRSLSEYYMGTGDYVQAEAAIHELERIQPLGEYSLLNAGYLAGLLKDRAKAKEIMKKLKDNFPEGSAISGSVGLIYYALGDLDKFFELMFQAAENHTLFATTLLRSPLFVAAEKGSAISKAFREN